MEFYERQKLSEFDALRSREEFRLEGGVIHITLQEKIFQHFVKAIEEQAESLRKDEAAIRKAKLWGSNPKEMTIEESFDLHNNLTTSSRRPSSHTKILERSLLGLCHS